MNSGSGAGGAVHAVTESRRCPAAESGAFDRNLPADLLAGYRAAGMASALVRPFDSGVASNRFILLVTPLTGVVAGVVSMAAGEGLGEAWRRGVSGGGAAFLSWAIGRELDPDRPSTACVAASLGPWLILIGSPDLLGAALTLLTVRMVAGTTGRWPTQADAVVMVIATAAVAARPTGTGFAAVAVLGVAVAAIYEPRARSRMLIGAAAMASAGAGAAWWAGRSPTGPTTPGDAALVLFIAGVAAAGLSVVLLRRVAAPTDRAHGGTVSTARVRLARVIVAAAALGAWLWAGDSGVLAAAPLWTALGASVIVFVGSGFGALFRSRRPVGDP